MKIHGFFGEDSKINQILCAILINLPVISYGASIGWMSPMSLLLQSKDSPKGVPLTDTEASWGFFLISLEVWALIIGRCLVGVTMSGAYIICPIYTKEISDDSVRGALGCFVILFHTIGNLFTYILGDLLSYYTILWVCLAIPCSHIVLFLFMPDSPSCFVKRERVEDATKAIAWLRCTSTLDSRVLDEINQIKSEQKKDDEAKEFMLKTILNMPVLSYGASIGWMSPMSLLLQSENSPRGTPLTDIEVSWMAAIPYLVCVPADILIAMLMDKWGRKTALIIVSLAGATSWALLLVSLDLWALLLARSLVGITMAGSYVICPIYTKEISDDTIRGALGCFVILFHTIGNLALYIVGDILNYSTVLWICLSVPTSHVVLFFFMPESPSYLVKRKKLEKASKAIAWLRCKPVEDSQIQEELKIINNEQKNDESNKFLLKSIITDKTLRKAFEISMIATLAREVCGAVPVLNFAGEIFTLAARDSGLVLSPNQQAMLLGAVQVVGSVLASSVVEKAGRKPLLILSSVVSGLSMCVLASWFLLQSYQIYTPSWIPLFTLCLCIFSDASGIQPMSMIVVGEIFSFKYRGTVMGTTMASCSLADFLQLLFFKPLVNSVGIHVAFYFFGAICLSMAVYVIYVIPETRARSLEDIYMDLGKEGHSKNKKVDVKNVSDNDVI